MKRTFLFLAFFLFVSFSFGQTKVQKDAAGNYVTIKAVREKKPEKSTGSFFILNDSTKLPVMVTDSGKLYVNRISKKTGNSYKQYLIAE